MSLTLPQYVAHRAENAPAAHAAADTNSSAGATTDKSTITASDFLTLLVTEMKNQDPTQPSDPTQYLQQLVGVNSLQQLIEINQQLSGSSKSSSTQGS